MLVLQHALHEDMRGAPRRDPVARLRDGALRRRLRRRNRRRERVIVQVCHPPPVANRHKVGRLTAPAQLKDSACGLGVLDALTDDAHHDRRHRGQLHPACSTVSGEGDFLESDAEEEGLVEHLGRCHGRGDPTAHILVRPSARTVVIGGVRSASAAAVACYELRAWSCA